MSKAPSVSGRRQTDETRLMQDSPKPRTTIACRFESRSILLSLELHNDCPLPQVPWSVCAQNSNPTHRQQGHDACQSALLWLTSPVRSVLHLHFTVLCAGRLTSLGCAWLIWLAQHCLPATAIKRLALQHPSTRMLL